MTHNNQCYEKYQYSAHESVKWLQAVWKIDIPTKTEDSFHLAIPLLNIYSIQYVLQCNKRIEECS